MSVATMLKRLYRRGGVSGLFLAIPAEVRRAWLTRDSRTVNRILTRLGASIVGDVVIDVPEFGGHFACSPRSHLFSRIVDSGAYEPGLVQLFRKHLAVDRDVIDVGANIGFYSVLAASIRPRRRVLAVEPSPEALRRLRDNLRRNEVEELVVVYEGLASDQNGASTLNVIEGMEEYSSVGKIAHASVLDKASRNIPVEASTLDNLVEFHGLNPGLIKIDVEGAEAQVIRGAAETIRRFKPVILSEFSPVLLRQMGTDPQQLLNDLRSAGYRVIDADEPSLDPMRRDYGDILCLPR